MAAVAVSANSISIESLRHSWCINLDRSTTNSLRFSLDSHSLSGYFDLDLDLHCIAAGGGAHNDASPSSVPPGQIDSCPRNSILLMRKKPGVFKRCIGLILRPLNRILFGKRRMTSKVGAVDDRNNRINRGDYYCGSYYCDRESEIREAVLHCKQEINLQEIK